MHANMPRNEIIRDIADFDRGSGTIVERLLFNHRPIVIALCLILTAILGWQASGIGVNASFDRMIPRQHPFVVNFFKHYDDLKQQGNAIRVVVETEKSSIMDRDYLDTLRAATDDIAALPGVDKGLITSLWTPSTRWTAVTEEGFQGDLVIPDSYDGSPAAIEQVRRNIGVSGLIGQMVAPDFRSSIVYAPLRDHDAAGRPLDYGDLGRQLEQLREKYAAKGVTLHITGFAKVVADMIEANFRVLMFFGVSIVIATLILYFYTRCVSSTLLVVACSLVAVLWQVGLIAAFGGELDPYSILVPFLIFAIGMSHGAQKMNGVMQDIARGTHRLVAARYTFRRLFMAGFAALLCDAFGFAVLCIIKIEAIQQLAIIASMGVAILIFTNLILLPILLSYVGVSRAAAERSLRRDAQAERGRHQLWDFLCLFTQRRYALAALVVAVAMGVGGAYVSHRGLAVGDLDKGAPELRADSRYNRDNAYLTTHYATSSDVLVVMAETAPGQCNDYDVMERIDELEWRLQQLPGVESTASMASSARFLISGISEQNLRWYELLHSQRTLNDISQAGALNLVNRACSLDPLYVYLKDHRADTLGAVVAAVESYKAQAPGGPVTFLLAGGNAGIEAATNIVVKNALGTMLYWVYGAVSLLSLIAFRSWRATVCAVLPLLLTSILAEALMVWLGIGVKVATLPVVALGVGIGVDYALYVLSITLAFHRQGVPLADAYRRSLMFTGKVVLLTGFTLAAGVITWVAAPIKFQADMGVLLSFMFLWNMVGALIPLPALACFLLPNRAEPTVAPAARAASKA